MATHHVPRPGERPDVEVQVDGQWWPGEVRMQSQQDDGEWVIQVQWRRAPGETRIGTFPAARVRPAEESV